MPYGYLYTDVSGIVPNTLHKWLLNIQQDGHYNPHISISSLLEEALLSIYLYGQHGTWNTSSAQIRQLFR